MGPWSANVTSYKTAIFRQVNKDKAYTHHDALEFPNGEIVLLTTSAAGQQATVVLQLPAEPQKPQEEPAVARQSDWRSRSAEQTSCLLARSAPPLDQGGRGCLLSVEARVRLGGTAQFLSTFVISERQEYRNSRQSAQRQSRSV